MGACYQLFSILNVQNFEMRNSEAVGRFLLSTTAILMMYVKSLGPRTVAELLPLHLPLAQASNITRFPEIAGTPPQGTHGHGARRASCYRPVCEPSLESM